MGTQHSWTILGEEKALKKKKSKHRFVYPPFRKSSLELFGVWPEAGGRRGRERWTNSPLPPDPDVSPRNRTSQQAAAGGDEPAAVQPEMDAGVLQGAQGACISGGASWCFPGQPQAQLTPESFGQTLGTHDTSLPNRHQDTYTHSSRLLTYTARTSRTTQSSYYSYSSHDFCFTNSILKPYTVLKFYGGSGDGLRFYHRLFLYFLNKFRNVLPFPQTIDKCV